MASPALAALAGGALRLTVFIHLGGSMVEAGETNSVEGKVYTFYGKLEDSHLAGKTKLNHLYLEDTFIKDGFDISKFCYMLVYPSGTFIHPIFGNTACFGCCIDLSDIFRGDLE